MIRMMFSRLLLPKEVFFVTILAEIKKVMIMSECNSYDLEKCKRGYDCDWSVTKRQREFQYCNRVKGFLPFNIDNYLTFREFSSGEKHRTEGGTECGAEWKVGLGMNEKSFSSASASLLAILQDFDSERYCLKITSGNTSKHREKNTEVNNPKSNEHKVTLINMVAATDWEDSEASTTWLGTNSSDLITAANWSDGVPTTTEPTILFWKIIQLEQLKLISVNNRL